MEIITFGEFRLAPASRLLQKNGVELRIGSRALDILIVLVERAGEIVRPKELEARVWRGLVVDSSGLRVHMTALRKALGDGVGASRHVINVPGQGYCFVAPVTRAHAEEIRPTLQPDPTDERAALPPMLERIVGREAAIANLSRDVLEQRIVTIVGSGGVGKTTVAVAVGHKLAPEFRDGVHFLDLSLAVDSASARYLLTASLSQGLEANAICVGEHLGSRRLLLILDNCEHLIEEVASIGTQIVTHASDIHILASSREALRVHGERVYLLPPLSWPGLSSGLTAAKAREFSAIQLFVERTRASGGNFALSDTNASVVARICDKLDGIALAIEIAADRTATFGLADVESGIEFGAHLKWRGKRSAPLRHQSLTALYEWSYKLLTESAQMTLRALCKQSGPFSWNGLSAASSGLSGASEIVDSLVAQSLLAVLPGDDGAIGYRLMNLARAYGLEKCGAGCNGN
jgi:predicted ATPase/DNA-binding winged helix-turn-helix (wHTH) protein